MPNPTAGGRRVVANIGLTMDGYYQGPKGRGDLFPYAMEAEVGYQQIERTIQTATTAVLGRVNGIEFLTYWPTVIGTGEVDPRDEAFAKWLVAADKVILSTTLTEPPAAGVRIVNAPTAEVITELKAGGEGDILICWSASVIRALLAAELIDRLNLIISPVIGGSGSRLLDDPLPRSEWTLVHQDASERGVLGLTYDRIP